MSAEGLAAVVNVQIDANGVSIFWSITWVSHRT